MDLMTSNQQRSTVSEMASDWHGLVAFYSITRPPSAYTLTDVRAAVQHKTYHNTGPVGWTFPFPLGEGKG